MAGWCIESRDGVHKLSMVMFHKQQFYLLFGQIQTSQTGGQPNNKVSLVTDVYSVLFVKVVPSQAADFDLSQ